MGRVKLKLKHRHGTERCYNAGCRRPECREAASHATLLTQLGHLLVTCWCENDVVAVTPQDVKAGRTRSCGKPRCFAT